MKRIHGLVITPVRRGEGQRRVGADLGPLHAPAANRVADEPLARRQLGGAGLHLDEHDASQIALVEPVEHHEVHGSAEELGVLGIEAESGEVRHELLVDLPARHRSTLQRPLGAHAARELRRDDRDDEERDDRSDRYPDEKHAHSMPRCSEGEGASI